MKLQFNDKVYDILKWLCLIALPALSVLYSALAGVWGWPYAQEVATTINAVVAFVDESLTDEEAQGLQSQLSGISGVADCTFVSRQEARDEYVDQYNEDDLYSDLDPTIFRHRYVMHLTDLKLMDQVVQQLDETEGIAKVRADQDISNGFITVRNIASVISIALIAILLIISVFIISNTIKLTPFPRRAAIANLKMWGDTNA